MVRRPAATLPAADSATEFTATLPGMNGWLAHLGAHSRNV